MINLPPQFGSHMSTNSDLLDRQRKELSHTGLINEIIQQLSPSFKPEVPMMKRRIEDLIAREYLERVDDSSPPTYRYLA
jgi:cullin 3